MENLDGISQDRALLSEIVVVRYMTFGLTCMPFDDHRRLRDRDPDLVVPFPVNDASAPSHVGRLPYASTELDANSNAPGADPGIFSKTEVNQ